MTWMQVGEIHLEIWESFSGGEELSALQGEEVEDRVIMVQLHHIFPLYYILQPSLASG